jgi:hypothetical protein
MNKKKQFLPILILSLISCTPEWEKEGFSSEEVFNAAKVIGFEDEKTYLQALDKGFKNSADYLLANELGVDDASVLEIAKAAEISNQSAWDEFLKEANGQGFLGEGFTPRVISDYWEAKRLNISSFEELMKFKLSQFQQWEEDEPDKFFDFGSYKFSDYLDGRNQTCTPVQIYPNKPESGIYKSGDFWCGRGKKWAARQKKVANLRVHEYISTNFATEKQKRDSGSELLRFKIQPKVYKMTFSNRPFREGRYGNYYAPVTIFLLLGKYPDSETMKKAGAQLDPRYASGKPNYLVSKEILITDVEVNENICKKTYLDQFVKHFRKRWWVQPQFEGITYTRDWGRNFTVDKDLEFATWDWSNELRKDGYVESVELLPSSLTEIKFRYAERIFACLNWSKENEAKLSMDFYEFPVNPL